MLPLCQLSTPDTIKCKVWTTVVSNSLFFNHKLSSIVGDVLLSIGNKGWSWLDQIQFGLLIFKYLVSHYITKLSYQSRNLDDIPGIIPEHTYEKTESGNIKGFSKITKVLESMKLEPSYLNFHFNIFCFRSLSIKVEYYSSNSTLALCEGVCFLI